MNIIHQQRKFGDLQCSKPIVLQAVKFNVKKIVVMG
mgnify:CR=1 FL=1